MQNDIEIEVQNVEILATETKTQSNDHITKTNEIKQAENIDELTSLPDNLTVTYHPYFLFVLCFSCIMFSFQKNSSQIHLKPIGIFSTLFSFLFPSLSLWYLFSLAS